MSMGGWEGEIALTDLHLMRWVVRKSRNPPDGWPASCKFIHECKFLHVKAGYTRHPPLICA